MKSILKMIKFILLFFISINLVNAQNYENAFKKYPNFNGTVLIAENGNVKLIKAIGLANRQDNLPIKANSKFRICSITKTFTAAIILQLFEENKLTLEDKISKFLPKYEGEVKDKVNIHHLLTYSSGIQNLDQNSEEMYALKLPIDSILSKYCSGKLVTAPGQQFDYKNADFIILGKIIEAIENQTFEKVLQTRILDKLGMKNTGMLSQGKILSGLANPYLYDSITKTFKNDDPYWIENFYSAGAMYSSIEDLYKFDQAIFNHKLFSANTLKIMLKPNPELWNVAYGFWVSENEYLGKKYLCADRQGSISGSNTTWLHLINENKTFMIFGNTDAVNLSDLRTDLINIHLKN